MGLDKLSPELVAKMTELDKKYNPVQQQLTALQDIADMVQELLNVADSTKSNTDQLKALGAVLDDSRQQLVEINKKESPETPDYAKPVVAAVNQLSKEITAQLNKIDVKPQVKVDAPVVNVPAPNVNVSPTDVTVDLSKIEKTLKQDIPKAFKDAIAAIPAPAPQDDSAVIDKLAELGQTLADIDQGVRMKPQPGSMKVTNLDGSVVYQKNLLRGYNNLAFTNADANGNYQTITYTNDDATTTVLTLTFDGSSHVTNISRV